MTQHDRVYDSRHVANHLLDLAGREAKPIVPAQIIKLVYLCHGWSLGLLHRPLVIEDVEAWRVGPVIRRLHEEVGEGGQPIERRLDAPGSAALTDEEADIVRQVLGVYGNMSAVNLSALTLTRGTPWDLTWRRHGDGAVIPKDLIEVHFAGLARNSGGRVATNPAV